MRQLPIGIQTFKKIIEQDLVYVDKTAHIHRLVKSGAYFFLSRPRRFGKTLLMSTLKSYFKGEEDLFKGLKIYDLEKDWKKYPVVHIDYSKITLTKETTAFEDTLNKLFTNIGKEYGLQIEEKYSHSAFLSLISLLYEKSGKVVILIDEYDKPLVDFLQDTKTFNENITILQNLYGLIKGLDEKLHFMLITGVSRFAKIGIFSGMNHIKDITLDERYADIVGFTQEELYSNFEEYLSRVQNRYNYTREQLRNTYRKKYNGYSWNGKTKLYNPFSILNSLDEQDFLYYWFSTGTPNFLTKIIKEQHFLPQNLEGVKTQDLIGSSLSLNNYPIVPLLFQTGYLTIKDIWHDNDLRRNYRLDYPNEEVRDAFVNQLAASFLNTPDISPRTEARDLKNALLEEKTDDFINILRSFFADIPSRLHIAKEAYYHSIVYLLLRLVGITALLEKETSVGRIDAVIEYSEKIYILEFKFARKDTVKDVNILAEKAIAQIEEMKYFEPYTASGKKIILFGIGFSDKKTAGKTKVLQLPYSP